MPLIQSATLLLAVRNRGPGYWSRRTHHIHSTALPGPS